MKNLQAELSEANRKSAESIKEINKLKHKINKDTYQWYTEYYRREYR